MRVLVFYIGGVFIIGLLVPSNNTLLNLNSNNASASPFVIAFNEAGIKVLPSVRYRSERLLSFSDADTSYRSSTLLFCPLRGLLVQVTSTSHRVVYVWRPYFQRGHS